MVKMKTLFSICLVIVVSTASHSQILKRISNDIKNEAEWKLRAKTRQKTSEAIDSALSPNKNIEKKKEDAKKYSQKQTSAASTSSPANADKTPSGSPDAILSKPLSQAIKKNSRISDNDGDWSAQNVALANTQEAEWMIRTGDIDNLGFGWAEGFTPFSGKSTLSHGFPWARDPEDMPGTDMIMIPSGYKPATAKGSDGYTGATKRPDNNPRSLVLNLSAVKKTSVHSASLQLFVDDFQSPVFSSKFQVKLNGIRLIEMEKLLNALQQTGPVGKLLNIKIPNEFLPILRSDSLVLFIDDPVNSVGDGFAIDFVKLLVNPKEFIYKGNVKGTVIDRLTRQPITNATAEIRDYATAEADKEGRFSFENMPSGISIITSSAPGYASATAQVDVMTNETSDGIIIELSPSEKIIFDNKTMREGDELVLNNIQFELASANLTDRGRQELNRLSAFMHQNAKVEILLSGHTSTDGSSAFNKELSVNRVKSCKLYLITKGIDDGRIQIIGYGSDKPLVSNDTEKNRSKNRRVEMKITKL